MGFVLILSFAVFTVVEAHIVSVYIARNYILFLLGAYWTGMFPFDGDDISLNKKIMDGKAGEERTVLKQKML